MSTTGDTRKLEMSDSEYVALFREIDRNHCLQCERIHDEINGILRKNGELDIDTGIILPTHIAFYGVEHQIGPAVANLLTKLHESVD